MSRLAAALACSLTLAGTPTFARADIGTLQVANGTFDVSMTPIAAGSLPVSSMAMTKRFAGDLVGTSVGQFIGYLTPKAGSAGYVAIEVFTGSLFGRRGSFALQHTGTMYHGTLQSKVTVVPNSGTGDLTGLAGAMIIDAQGAKHRYTFRYNLY